MAISSVAIRGKHHCYRWVGKALALAMVWGGGSQAAQSDIKATVIDRLGNRHEVSKFTFQDRSELDYYVGDVRRIMPFARIDRIVFEGNRGDEEQTITVHLRKGTTEVGSILTGGNAAPRAHDAFGSGQAGILFAGVSELGPFIMRLNEAREVIIRHPSGASLVKPDSLKASLITVKGERYEVSQLRYLGKTRFTFNQGRMRGRSINMGKVDKIDFIATASPEEQRPVTIALRSGNTLQGTVDISVMRLPGETNKAYYARMNTVFTGKSKAGTFSIGLQDVKHIRFHQESEEAGTGGTSGGEHEKDKGAAEGGAEKQN